MKPRRRKEREVRREEIVCGQVSAKKLHTATERRRAIERIRQRRKGLSLGGLKIRDLIDEARL